MRPGDRGPGAGQGRRVGLVGSQAQEVGEGLELALAGVGEDCAQQVVTAAEVVDQHPGRRRARGHGERFQPIGEAELEGMVGTGVEEPLLDLRLYAVCPRRHYFV